MLTSVKFLFAIKYVPDFYNHYIGNVYDANSCSYCFSYKKDKKNYGTLSILCFVSFIPCLKTDGKTTIPRVMCTSNFLSIILSLQMPRRLKKNCL